VVLAAGNWLCDHPDWNCDFAILSGGTDGEDGPTDAAGAWIDRAWVQRCRTTRIETQKALDRCDAYTLFEQTGNLLRTGPTNTNVCDLRVGVVRGAAIP
jgi:glycerate-2-kinase